jgi:hypothetical protein
MPQRHSLRPGRMPGFFMLDNRTIVSARLAACRSNCLLAYSGISRTDQPPNSYVLIHSSRIGGSARLVSQKPIVEMSKDRSR